MRVSAMTLARRAWDTTSPSKQETSTHTKLDPDEFITGKPKTVDTIQWRVMGNGKKPVHQSIRVGSGDFLFSGDLQAHLPVQIQVQ